MIPQARLEELVRDRCFDNEKWLLAQAVLNLRQQLKDVRREHQEELNDAARGAQDEATWRQIQGDDYGSY